MREWRHSSFLSQNDVQKVQIRDFLHSSPVWSGSGAGGGVISHGRMGFSKWIDLNECQFSDFQGGLDYALTAVGSQIDVSDEDKGGAGWKVINYR